MHPTKNRLSWMDLGAAPLRSAHIRVGALGGRSERRGLSPSRQLVCWVASGFWLLCDPSGEPVQSSTAAKNAGDPFSGPEKLLDTPCGWPGGVGRHPGGSWLLSWRGQRKSWTVPDQSRGYPLETSPERWENVVLSGSIP